MERSATAFGWRSLLDLILPVSCHACRRPIRGAADPFFCPDCWSTIARLDGPCCPSCGRPFASAAALSHSPNHRCGDCRKRAPKFNRAVSVGRYEGVLAEAIRLFKYRGRTRLAGPIGALMSGAAGRLRDAEAMVPVPLHPARLRAREYNQALLLCDRLREATGLPVIADGLARTRETPPQIGLTLPERRRNMRGAFAAKRPDGIRGRRILLIDDVLTTGATANECARVLRRAGARAVYVLTAARTCGGVG